MSLVDVIQGSTSDTRVQLALLMGALLEGGSLAGPWSAGDNGSSFGPYQIHLPAHPDFTPETASDPAAAVSGWALPAYSDAVNQVSDALWLSDPAQAAADAAYIAERPAYMYPASRVASAWDTLVRAGGSAPDFLGARGVAGPGVGFSLPGVFRPDFWSRLKNWVGPGSGIADAAGSAAGASQSLVPDLSGLKAIGAFFAKAADPHTWAKFGLTAAAAILIVIGLLLAFKVSPPKIVPVPV